ncbi:hypothetical protein [Georgenia sp. SYP-B2076]|uniref:hypothetical protein n=1 Tax=Georgenia sp. SYP-B2076 TaxID=2495881 RepID=UPI0013DED959|nr:hypothetical protein [Georgenia sp. SYP-B2076]
MDPTSKKCLIVGIILCIVGAPLIRYTPDLYFAVTGGLGAGAEVGMVALDLLSTIVQWVVVPLGTTFIGAAIVIETLLRRWRHGTEDNYN